MSARPRVLAIVGQTGTGKSELAAEVARRTGAEIIGCDSMQVYRGMDVGTAKPSAELRAEIPHHAIDVVEPDDAMSAGRYARLARDAAHDAASRGRPIILCGGTGLYARAFAGGLIGGVASDPAVRATLEARSTDALRQALERADPTAARRIEPGDRVRLVRALEVIELAQAPLSDRHDAHAFSDRPFDVVWMGLRLEREPLWAALRERVDAMFEGGLVDEVAGLRDRYAPPPAPLRAIGYREVGEMLEGGLDEAAAREAIFIATRRYAKRQLTWFRAEPELRWFDASDAVAAVRAAEEALDAGTRRATG